MTEKSGGLAGMVAGDSAICTVGKEGVGLNYRGYSINDLAEKACFEEVAFLLLYGKLPTHNELIGYKEHLMGLRDLPNKLKTVLELTPKDAHPMDVLRTGCSVLGTIEQEKNFNQQSDIADRLLACFPSMLTYWYQFHFYNNKIDLKSSEKSMAGFFLEKLHNKPADKKHREALDASLILYAEHEFNASTFAARVTAATLSDFYSAICSAIGTLRGPLHGGANEKAMELIQRFKTVEEAEKGLIEMLSNKAKIMGFGHRVYTKCDPRSAIIKSFFKL